MNDPRGYTHKNFPPRQAGHNPPPSSAGDGWRFLLGEEVLIIGDEFWATARGCWVQILEPSWLGRNADVAIELMRTKCRRVVDPSLTKEDREKDTTAA